MDFLNTLHADGVIVGDILQEFCGALSDSEVNRALKYSLFSDGKKLRPCLVLESAKLLGGSENDNNVRRIAAAIEMIHTYSLIHDDLPCMDDDDSRRGKPACHKVFGEGMAVLAGDALLNLAFETLLGGDYSKPYFDAIKFIAECSGARGMIDGQSSDIGGAPKNNVEALLNLTAQKTSKLIVASTVAAGIYLNSNQQERCALRVFGEQFGIAFQIADDLLDSGSGEECNFVNVLGKDRAVELLENATRNAVSALEVFDGRAGFFKELAEFNTCRKL